METSNTDAPYVTFLGSDDWRIIVVMPGVPNGFLRGLDGKSLKFKTREEAEAFCIQMQKTS